MKRFQKQIFGFALVGLYRHQDAGPRSAIGSAASAQGSETCALPRLELASNLITFCEATVSRSVQLVADQDRLILSLEDGTVCGHTCYLG